jgi:protein-S-isoprenylcysteine O-methyltransferase Ste14
MTGGAAASLAERVPGNTEAAIAQHQDAAAVAVVLICLTGIFSIAAFFADGARWIVRAGIVLCVFALAIVALVSIGYTANLGGQIHQTEITASK